MRKYNRKYTSNLGWGRWKGPAIGLGAIGANGAVDLLSVVGWVDGQAALLHCNVCAGAAVALWAMVMRDSPGLGRHTFCAVARGLDVPIGVDCVAQVYSASTSQAGGASALEAPRVRS